MLSLFVIPGVFASNSITVEEEEKEIKAVIDEYFTLRYEAQKNTKQLDLSSITDTSKTPTVTNNWLNREQKKQEIEFYIAETFDSRIIDYKFYLDYQSIKIDNSVAVVTLLESHDVYFSSDPDSLAQMANLEHVITLNKVKGQWRLTNDTYRDEMVELMEALPIDEILKNVKTNHDIQYSQQAEVEPPQLLGTYSYNGTAAANYSNQWALARNPTYHDEPNDCTNFASQAVYAGTNGTTSDPNDYNNKWYYDFYSHTGSLPWVRVSSFYTFLTSNNGKGPYGYSSGAYLCNLGKGHVVTMKKNGDWAHTVVVSSIDGSCHVPSNIKINSHTVDRYRYPLSNYSGYVWYAITISGYRT